MIPGRIEGATRVLKAPANWDGETHGPCGALYIRDEGHCMASAWLPSTEELARLAAGASIMLWIVGASHPPVMLGVGNVP